MNSSVAAQIIEAMDAQTSAFEADVLAGLSCERKTLPSRWLYDDRGSDLFEQITRLPEYYPTRTETAILSDNAEALATFCGRQAIIIEYGAGASVKSQILLNALQQPRMYVPVDIAG
ncbi:MAG: L-histidine N(alpha)-methyltransferase, partial [Hyphomicrobiaceae bacterium]